MRIILLSIAFLFLAFSAQSQVLKSAGVWYFLDVDSMTARPAVLPNGTELAYVVGTKTVYYWNRNTSTWTAYGSTFNRDSIYFDASIIGSGTVSDPWGVDSTLFATIAGVGDSIAAELSAYLPIADTAAMLTNYPSTVGYGILKNTKTIRVDTTSPNGLATRLFAKTLPTSILTGQVAYSNGSNLVGNPNFTFSTPNLTLGGSNPYIYHGGNSLRIKPTTDVIQVLELRGSPSFGNRIDMYSAGDVTKSIQIANNTVSYFNTGFNFLIGTTTDVPTSILTARSTTKSSSPFPLHTLAESDAITGVQGNFDYETTQNGLRWYNGTRKAYALESTFARGTATRVPFFDANGQITDNAAVTINLTGVLGRMEIRGSIDQKTFVVRRTNSAQTTNVFEVASESGGSIVGINSLGYIDAIDLRLRNNGRTAFRGVTNFPTFVDNVTSTFFQVSNSSDGNRLLFTSENGNPLARLAFLSTGAYIYDGTFATSPAPVSLFAVINTTPSRQPMTIKLASPQNVDAFRITSSADVKLFHVESDGKVAIKNSTTAARDLDVNGEVRIRDLTTDSPVDIVGADGDGDLGRVSLSGLSISGGTLTVQNIGNTNLTLSGNRTLTGAGYWLKYPNMEFNIGDTTWLFSNGIRPYLYARSKTYKPNQDSVAGQIILNTNGPQANLQLFGSANAGNNFSGAIFLYDLSANTTKNKGWFIANDQRDLTEDGLNFKQVGTGFSGFNTHYIMRNNGTFTVGAPTLSPVMAISHDTVLIGKLPIINANINGNVAYSEAPFKVVNLGTIGSPSASNKVIVNAKFYIGTDSTLKFDPANDLLQLNQYGTGAKEAADISKTQSNYIAGFATDGTVLDLERKRDTTIYVTDADYNFASAVTSANILKRYNRIIIYSKLSSGATSDNQIFLHSASVDFLQCEIIIYSNDASADSDATSIDFTTNGAVDGAGGTVSSYSMSAGQRVNIRAVDDGGYKWFFN